MSINILFFGMATDLVGTSSDTFQLGEEKDLENFKNLLFERYPSLKNMHQFAIAINEVYAEENSLVKPGDTIAIIPPVSGG